VPSRDMDGLNYALQSKEHPRCTRGYGTRPCVTPSFKFKIECIPLCVLGSSFTHKVANSEINSITNVYYIISDYKKNLLHVQNGLSSEKDTILPQADDWGPTRLKEVFIKELLIL
jgi:hypothetical protein